MGYLVLVRHGESRWNSDNKFTGWVDIPLNEVGIYESQICAKQLEGLKFDVAFTSRLKRAHETLLIILARQDYTGIFLHESKKSKKWGVYHHEPGEKELPIFSSTALNERYYGKLQGFDKQKMREKYGENTVFKWRRSWDEKPPGGESLKDTVKRAFPYFKKHIMPSIKEGKNVLVVAHGNSLRGIIKYIDNVSDKDIPALELPTGKPIIYLYETGKLVKENHIHSFNRSTNWLYKYKKKKKAKKQKKK